MELALIILIPALLLSAATINLVARAEAEVLRRHQPR
jgi:hypothetical protein